MKHAAINTARRRVFSEVTILEEMAANWYYTNEGKSSGE
jgi:hypothetical protein